jgi:hypothetical protein
MVMGTRILGRISEPKRNDIMEGWRKLHNEELHDLYSSPRIIRMINSRWMRWAGYVAQMVEKSTYRVLVGKLEGKRPLGRSRCLWVDNVKMDPRIRM